MRPTLHTADVVQYAAAYQGEPYHALLCDPPYELGFMGKHWDASGIAFRAETWAAFLPLLHPGAFGMAFAGSRGLHRMMVAIEDAGYVIHPTMGFCFGTGFPKATRIDTQIDAAAGEDGDRYLAEDASRKRAMAFGMTAGGQATYTASTDLARAWAGHRYGLQALKPALEFIVVFQKPYQGRPVDSMVATGAGALNIDAARVGTDTDDPNRRDHPSIDQNSAGIAWGLGKTQRNPTLQVGRWPSNLVLSHSYDCDPPACVPGCAVAALGAQSGVTTSTGGASNDPVPLLFKRSLQASHGYRPDGPGYAGERKEHPVTDPGKHDTGTAARFFFQADYAAERLEAAEPIFYCAKSSTAEREAGLSGRQRRLAAVTGWSGDSMPLRQDGTERHEVQRANIHPTCKPIALARHLATLLLPPALYAPRRLFIPFAGVASECIGAMQAGWEIIDGVELERDHVEIGRARIDFWAEQGVQLTLFDEDD